MGACPAEAGHALCGSLESDTRARRVYVSCPGVCVRQDVRRRKGWVRMGKRSSALWDVLIVAALAGASVLGVVVEAEEGFHFLKWYREANSLVQGTILIFLFLTAVAGAVRFLRERDRVSRLEASLAEAQQANEDAFEEGAAFGAAEREGLQQEVSELKEDLTSQKTIYDKILGVGREAWRQPLGNNAVAWVPPTSRGNLKILSVLNLKGGVGKTTITANLGACLAQVGSPKRVLLVDLDFQGTLSRMALDQERLERAASRSQTSMQLLREVIPTEAEVENLILSSTDQERLHVIPTDDQLEDANLKALAQFLLDPANEVRHRFRQIFHYYELFHDYDLILFDCPPRLTAASVNALCASDYVVIPTQPTRAAMDAVPRTVDWIRTLGQACQAQILGVIGNQVRNINAHSDAFGLLQNILDEQDQTVRIFDTKIGVEDTQIAMAQPGTIPATRAAARRVFEPLANELLRRL